MAAGTFVVYDSAKLALGNAGVDLSSATFVMVPLNSSYSYNANHSDFATQIASFEVSDASSSASLQKTLSNVVWTLSAANSLKFDCDNVIITASAAVKVKYMLIKTQGGIPIAYHDTNVGVTTGVEATTITESFNANGVFKLSQSN